MLTEMFDVETDVRQEAQKVIGIFQNEARMKRIALSLKIGESVERLGVDAIKTDPVRLGQVCVSFTFPWPYDRFGVADDCLVRDTQAARWTLQG